MTLGFTGTRYGLSIAQAVQLRMLLMALYSKEAQNVFHHGDGADEDGDDASADRQAATIANALGYRVVPHSPKARTAAALLARNVEVVEACTMLLAAPLRDKEEMRSGTWFTVRRARAQGKPVVMLSRGAS